MKIFTRMSKLTQSRMTKKMGLWLMLIITAFSSLQAQMSSVIPTEYTSGMTNPLMGFRDGLDNADNQFPYVTLVRDYINFNELEANAADINNVQKIIDYTNTNYGSLPNYNTKVIPRVILLFTENNNQDFWPSDLTVGDWTSETLKSRVLNMVYKLGVAWNNDPRIAFVEVGLIGQWGEQESPVGADEFLVGTKKERWSSLLNEAFKDAFPNKKFMVRNMDIWEDNTKAGKYWDSYGAWAQMQESDGSYQEMLRYNNLPNERYKHAFMQGEVAYAIANQGEMGTSEDQTVQTEKYRNWFIDCVRKIHTTTCGLEFTHTDTKNDLGSSLIQKAFGYRFLIKKFEANPRVEQGNTLNISARIVNDGSAPLYENWPLAVVLIDETTKQIVHKSIIPNVDISKWYPGSNYDWTPTGPGVAIGSRTYLTPAVENIVNASIQIPANLASGQYLVGLSILDPTTQLPGAFFSVPNFLQASNTQPLCRIGVGIDASSFTLNSSIFNAYDWKADTRIYNNVPQNVGPFTITQNSSTNGNVTLSDNSATYANNTKVTLTATPNPGYKFVAWGGSFEYNSTNPITINMNSNKNVYAIFKSTNPPAPVRTITPWVAGTTNNKVNGTNRLLTVMVMGEGAITLSANSATYGGQPMTKEIDRIYYKSGSSESNYCAIFTLNEAGISAATTGTIAVNWGVSPSGGGTIYSAMLENVDQTTPVSSKEGHALASYTVAAKALVASEDDMVLFCASTKNNNAITMYNGFTKVFGTASWGGAIGGTLMGNNTRVTPAFYQACASYAERAAICAISVKNAFSSTIPVKKYTITSSAGANGMINPNGAVLVDSLSSPVFAIIPNSGYQVQQVTVDGVNQGALSSYTFSNVVANHIISATFTAAPIQDQTITCISIPTKAVGNADFAPGCTASSGLVVSYASSNTAVATIVNGNIHIVGAGTSTITASQVGNAAYNPAPSVVQTLTVDPAPLCALPWSTGNFTITTINRTFSSGPIDISCAPSIKISANLTETSSFENGDTLKFSYKVNGGTLVNVVTLVNDFVSYNVNVTGITGSSLEIIIKGSQDASDEIYSISNMKVESEVAIIKQDQTITFGALANKTFGDADFSGNATASSGLAVTYASSNTAVATIVNGNIHLVGVGTTNITASQAGNATYNAAPSVVQTLTVNKANQTIIFPAIAAKTVGDADFNPGATASSGLAVTYTSSNTAVATIVSGNVHIVGAGSSNIIASQAGDANYNAAASVAQTLTVNLSQPSPDVIALTAWNSGTNNPKVAGSNRMLVVMVMGESGSSFLANSATYGGQTMTRVTDNVITSGSTTYSAIFILKEVGVNAATSGTINVTWSATPSAGSSVYSVLLANVDQTSTIVKANNGLAAATSITTTALAAASGDMVVMCGATANNTTITFNNGFSKKNESNSTWGDGVTGMKMGTGVNETPGFTQSASGRMSICAIVVMKTTTLKSAAIFTGIGKADENVIRVYPNPVSSMLNIEFANAEIRKQVKVFNSVGQLIHSVQTLNATAQIDVMSLNIKGIIVVQIITGNSISNHRVLIK